jgi:hypothetical protein
MSTDSPLAIVAIALYTAVPIWILELNQRSYEDNLKELFESASETAQLIGEKGDQLLFKGDKPGDTAKLFNKTARAIALMSFLPGGVTLFGRHWETTNPNK